MPDRDALINASLAEYSRLAQAMIPAKTACTMPWTDLPITLPQLRVLGVLYPSAGGMSGRELAGQLGVGPSAVTPLVDRLVEHGFVRREEDRADRRITRLLLTDAGLHVLERMTAGRRERMTDLLRHLDADELAVVHEAFELLNRAADRLKADSTPATGAPTAPPAAAAAAARSRSGPPVPADST